MCEGERRRLMVPWDMGYGAKGMKGVPPYSELQFDFELIELSSVKVKVRQPKRKHQTTAELASLIRRPCCSMVIISCRRRLKQRNGRSKSCNYGVPFGGDLTRCQSVCGDARSTYFMAIGDRQLLPRGA